MFTVRETLHHAPRSKIQSISGIWLINHKPSSKKSCSFVSFAVLLEARNFQTLMTCKHLISHSAIFHCENKINIVTKDRDFWFDNYEDKKASPEGITHLAQFKSLVQHPDHREVCFAGLPNTCYVTLSRDLILFLKMICF